MLDMIKKLPVAMPMFTAYHYAGSAGIIAANNPTLKSWYYSNTINWRCIQPTLEYYNLDLSICNCSIWDMPFIEKSNTSFRFIRKYVNKHNFILIKAKHMSEKNQNRNS